MKLDEFRMNFRQHLRKNQAKFRQNLDKIQTNFRARSRLTHFETIQTNLEKKNGQVQRMQNTPEFRQIKTKFRQIQNTLVHGCCASGSVL